MKKCLVIVALVLATASGAFAQWAPGSSLDQMNREADARIEREYREATQRVEMDRMRRENERQLQEARQRAEDAERRAEHEAYKARNGY